MHVCVYDCVLVCVAVCVCVCDWIVVRMPVLTHKWHSGSHVACPSTTCKFKQANKHTVRMETTSPTPHAAGPHAAGPHVVSLWHTLAHRRNRTG